MGEHIGKRGARTRGANYTSADFAFRFRRNDDQIQLVLGEWKYTEEYRSNDLGTPSKAGDTKPATRKKTYWPAYSRPSGSFAGCGEDLYNALPFLRTVLPVDAPSIAGPGDGTGRHWS